MTQCQRQNLFLRRFGAIQDARNRSAVHHDDPVAHAQDFRQLGRNHQDGHAAAGQLAHQAMDFGFGADVDALRRLVENQQLGLGGQPAGDRHFLLVAAGKVADRRIERRRLDRQLLHVIGGQRSFAAKVDPAIRRNAIAARPAWHWSLPASPGSRRAGAGLPAHRRFPTARPAPECGSRLACRAIQLRRHRPASNQTGSAPAPCGPRRPAPPGRQSRRPAPQS